MPHAATPTDSPPPATVLVGVQVQGTTSAELQSSLDELGRLARTLGLRPIGRVTQQRPGTGSASLLGEGKLRELAAWTGGSGVVPSGATHRRTGSKPRAEAHEPAADEPQDVEPEDESDVAAPPPAP